MKNLLLSILIAAFFAGFSGAQDKSDMSLGAGLLISLPMGDFSDAANLGVGATAAFEIGFTPQLVGVGNIGYISWGTDAEDYSYSAVPLMAGVKYFFTPGMGFYGLGQIGLTFFSIDTPYDEIYGVDTDASSTEFSLAIGAGYELPVSSNVMLDFTGAFNLISDLNHITLRAGAKFAL